MSNYTNGRGPADRARSRHQQESDLRDWIESLWRSELRLREAIDSASRSTERIRERLSRGNESGQAR